MCPPSHAFITRVYSLKEVMAASKVIVAGTLADVSAKHRTAVAAVERTLKGKCVFKRINMNIAVGQQWFPEALMKRMKAGAPVLFFYDDAGGKLACLGHTDGIWFQLFGELKGDPNKVWWRFTHVEIHMNRTYQGTTPELSGLVAKVLAGKAKPPAPNTKLGPLTREVILGSAREPARARPAAPKSRPPPQPTPGQVVGLEAHATWQVERWADSAEKVSVVDVGPRGKVLEVRSAAGQHGKVAVSRPFKADLSKARRLLFEAWHDGARPITVSCAFWTMPDWQFYESPGIELKPNRWRYDVEVDLRAATFKSAATDWEYSTVLKNAESVVQLTFIIDRADAGKGAVRIDRARLDTGSGFVRAIPLPHSGREARSVSWADYDGDDDLDVLVCSTRGNKLYQNRKGEFLDVTAAVGLKGGSRSASWADHDGDGDVDLFVSTPGLWTWDGAKFADTSGLLPQVAKRNPEGSGFMDADGDGRADILLTNGVHGLLLFLNRGTPSAGFEDVSAVWGLGADGPGRGSGDYVSITDFDGDGLAEFLYNLGHGILVRNDEGEAFRPAADTGIRYAAGVAHKLGVAFGDFDNDGDMDLFVPQKGASLLYRNGNDFSFTNVIGKSGDLATLAGNARTATWGDVNGDGNLDLVVGFTDTTARLFVGDGQGGFDDQSVMSGLPDLPSTVAATGMAFADWDDDGDPDLLVCGETSSAAVLVNAFPAEPACRPLRVRLDPSEPPGALVRLYDAEDRIVGIRQIAVAQNFSSQEPPEAVFCVRPGSYAVGVLLTDGEVIRKPITVGAQGVLARLSRRQPRG